MTKFLFALAATNALASTSCGNGVDASFQEDPGTTWGLSSARETTGSSAVKDAPGAECPTADSGQNASVSWLASFEEDLATNPSSVAVDARNDTYMTTRGGGVRKVDANGATLWTKPFGSLVATSDAGDVVVSGAFTDKLTLDELVLSSAGGSDVFVAHLDPDGNVVQAVALGGTGDETVAGLGVDHAGHVIVSGAGLGTVALDSADNPVWHTEFFGALATDAANDVLVTGALTGTTDFGGGPLTSAGGSDVFVVKLAADGSHQWSARYGDEGTEQLGQAIAADFEGNVFVAGVFDGSLDFGTGKLSLPHCPSEAWCNQSGFVVKFDPTGTPIWSVARGPMRALPGLAATAGGNVVVSGASPGDAAPYRLPILFALDADGAALWQHTEWPETGLGAGRGVAVDGCDAVLWSVAVKPSFDTNERAYLAKLIP